MSAPPFEPGARVRKVRSDPVNPSGDLHELGAVGTVLGAMGPLLPGTVIAGEDCGGEYAYAVTFDGDPPEMLTLIRGKKLEAM